MKIDPQRLLRRAGALVTAALLGAVPAAAGDGTISAGKLAKNAKDYYGKTVTVKAEVEDVFGDHTFSLDEDAVLAEGDILVILPEAKALGLRKDDDVVVTGVVRPYVVPDLDRDFDWFDDGKILKTKTVVDWENKPVLVAQAVRMADGREVYRTTAAAAAAHHPGHEARHTAHSGMKKTKKAKTMTTISAGDLAKKADTYYGQTVTVKGEVEDVLHAHAVTLDEDALFAGPDVLVLIPEGRAMSLKKDDDITVTGVVRRYVVADLDRDFDWFEDGKILKTETEVDFKTRPVLVATSVQTADGRELLTPPAARVRE